MTPSDILDALPIALLHPPAKEDDLRGVERQLSTPIPVQLRELLAVSNGVDVPHPYLPPGQRSVAVFGTGAIVQWTMFLRNEWNPNAEHNVGRGKRPTVDLQRCLLFAGSGTGDFFAYQWNRNQSSAALILLDHERWSASDVGTDDLRVLLPDLDEFAQYRGDTDA